MSNVPAPSRFFPNRSIYIFSHLFPDKSSRHSASNLITLPLKPEWFEWLSGQFEKNPRFHVQSEFDSATISQVNQNQHQVGWGKVTYRFHTPSHVTYALATNHFSWLNDSQKHRHPGVKANKPTRPKRDMSRKIQTQTNKYQTNNTNQQNQTAPKPNQTTNQKTNKQSWMINNVTKHPTST